MSNLRDALIRSGFTLPVESEAPEDRRRSPPPPPLVDFAAMDDAQLDLLIAEMEQAIAKGTARMEALRAQPDMSQEERRIHQRTGIWRAARKAELARAQAEALRRRKEAEERDKRERQERHEAVVAQHAARKLELARLQADTRHARHALLFVAAAERMLPPATVTAIWAEVERGR